MSTASIQPPVPAIGAEVMTSAAEAVIAPGLTPPVLTSSVVAAAGPMKSPATPEVFTDLIQNS